MSVDAEYEAFLEKANQDTSADDAGKATAVTTLQSKSPSIMTVNTAVPAALQDVQEYLISDADEPFEPVSLNWTEKELPSIDEFKELVGHEAEVITQSEAEFDPRSQYGRILRVVKGAGNGTAVFFKIEAGQTRAVYFIISLDEKGSRLVGLKAKAVES